MSNKSTSSSGGMGCGGVVQVVFIVLKLLGLIDWSWWWVMSPTIIGASISVIVLGFALIIYVSKS